MKGGGKVGAYMANNRILYRVLFTLDSGLTRIWRHVRHLLARLVRSG